jgi:hypothetical protein
MSFIAWAPIGSNAESVQLGSPYVRNDSHLIAPGEDFTVRLTTISKSVVSEYRERMEAGKYGNDYFCLLSHFGIGSNGNQKPSTSINHIARHDSLRSDVLSLWGENIRFIKDYRDKGADGNSGKIYISTSAMCQGLGKSKLDDIRTAYNQTSGLVGRFAPWITPYTSVGALAIDGILAILKKLREKKGECIEAALSLYPASMQSPLPFGDAYLQKGSYIFFYEDLTNSEASELFLHQSGQVVKRANSEVRIPPYCVINIVEGIIDAPSEIISRAIAVDIIEKYQKQHELTLGGVNGSMDLLLEGLQKIGDSYYYISQINRFKELARKGEARSEIETARMHEIKAELESRFEHIKMV